MQPKSAEVVSEVEACLLAWLGNLFQLVGNERHQGQVNEGKGWLVTFQASVLLVMDQRPGEILANSLHADWVTSWCMVSLGLWYHVGWQS